MGWRSSQLYPTSEGSPYEPFDPTICVHCEMYCVREQAWTVSLIGWTIQHAVLETQAQPGRLQR